MYEYKVVPAPQRAVKAKGLKTTAERFANALAERINAEAAGGWQFQRCETLPCEERSALGSSKMSQQVVMIFARPLGQARPDAGAALAAAQHGAPAPVAPTPLTLAHPVAAPRAEARLRNGGDGDDSAPTPQRRQEPLFRSGAMLRADPTTPRPEPVLRPRNAQTDDTDAG